MTNEDGCFVLKWHLDSTLFIGEIFARILDYMMDEFLSIERMVQVFDSMFSVHVVLAKPHKKKALCFGDESLFDGGEEEIGSFQYYAVKSTYFQMLTCYYLRARYKPHAIRRMEGIPKELQQQFFEKPWWKADAQFMDLLFHSRAFCVDCFDYLPLHVWERPAGPGCYFWQCPKQDKTEQTLSGDGTPGNPLSLIPNPDGASVVTNPWKDRSLKLKSFLQDEGNLTDHCLGYSHDFMQYDPLWRGEESYEAMVMKNAFPRGHTTPPSKRMSEDMKEAKEHLRHVRSTTGGPVAPPRCFTCLHKRHPMTDIPGAFGMLFQGLRERIPVTGTKCAEVLEDLVSDSFIYGLSQQLRKYSCGDSMVLCGVTAPPTAESLLQNKKRKQRILKSMKASVEKDKADPEDMDIEYLNHGSFEFGVFNSAITSISPPGLWTKDEANCDTLKFERNGYGSEFLHTLGEIMETLLHHPKPVGPTIDPYNPDMEEGEYLKPGTCRYNTHAGANPSDDPFAAAVPNTVGADTYASTHSALPFPFGSHKEMSSPDGAILQYILLKLLCLLPFKRMAVPRSVYRRAHVGMGVLKSGDVIEASTSLRGDHNPKEMEENRRKLLLKTGVANAVATGWQRLNWFYNLGLEVNGNFRGETYLRLLRRCPASFKEAGIEYDMFSFMEPSLLTSIPDVDNINRIIKGQLPETDTDKLMKTQHTIMHFPNVRDKPFDDVLSHDNYKRGYSSKKECRDNAAGGGSAVPAKRRIFNQRTDKAVYGKQMPVILKEDVQILIDLFASFFEALLAGEKKENPKGLWEKNPKLCWGDFEKQVCKRFFRFRVCGKRVPVSPMSIIRNGYPASFLSQVHPDGVWPYGDDIRHRLWYGCIGISDPFDDNLYPLDALVFSNKVREKAGHLANKLFSHRPHPFADRGEVQNIVPRVTTLAMKGYVSYAKAVQPVLARQGGKMTTDRWILYKNGIVDTYDFDPLKLEEGMMVCTVTPSIHSLQTEAACWRVYKRRDVSYRAYTKGMSHDGCYNSEFTQGPTEIAREPDGISEMGVRRRVYVGEKVKEFMESPIPRLEEGTPLKVKATPRVNRRVLTPDAPFSRRTNKRSWREVQDRFGKAWNKKEKTKKNKKD